MENPERPIDESHLRKRLSQHVYYYLRPILVQNLPLPLIFIQILIANPFSNKFFFKQKKNESCSFKESCSIP